MKPTILLIVFSVLLFSGCSQTTPSPSIVKAPKPELVAKIDKEAATLGFPKIFISKESQSIDWSEATSATVDDMDVQIYDTGITLEVCGGIGCDL